MITMHERCYRTIFQYLLFDWKHSKNLPESGPKKTKHSKPNIYWAESLGLNFRVQFFQDILLKQEAYEERSG